MLSPDSVHYDARHMGDCLDATYWYFEVCNLLRFLSAARTILFLLDLNFAIPQSPARLYVQVTETPEGFYISSTETQPPESLQI